MHSLRTNTLWVWRMIRPRQLSLSRIRAFGIYRVGASLFANTTTSSVLDTSRNAAPAASGGLSGPAPTRDGSSTQTARGVTMSKVIAAGVGLSLIGGLVPGRAVKASVAPPPARRGVEKVSRAELAEKGVALRNAVLLAYEEGIRSNRLSAGMNGNNITNVVRRFLPGGVSFSDAEQVLRGGGFSVSSRPIKLVESVRLDKFDVYGVLEPPSAELPPASRVQIFVQLHPVYGNDYTRNFEVTGSIFIISL